MTPTETAFAQNLIQFLGLEDQHIQALQLTLDAQSGIHAVVRLYPKGFLLAPEQTPELAFKTYKVDLAPILAPEVYNPVNDTVEGAKEKEVTAEVEIKV